MPVSLCAYAAPSSVSVGDRFRWRTFLRLVISVCLCTQGMLCAINGQLYAMTPVHSGNMPSGQYGQYAMAYNPVGQGPRGGAAALGVAPQVHLAMGASMGGQMVPGLMYAPMQLPGSQLGGYSG